jgi:hypothetical protein
MQRDPNNPTSPSATADPKTGAARTTTGTRGAARGEALPTGDALPRGGQQAGASRAGGEQQGAGAKVADKARSAVSDLTSRAGEEVSSRLDAQKDRAAEGLGTLAHALRQTGHQLGAEDQLKVQQYVDSLAGQVERFSGYLRDRDVAEMIDQVEDFARRRPALFVGGAFALGLLGARFLKSTSESAYGRQGGTRRRAARSLPGETPGPITTPGVGGVGRGARPDLRPAPDREDV